MENNEFDVVKGLRECQQDNLPSFVFVEPLLYADDNTDNYSFKDIERAKIHFLDRERKIHTSQVFDVGVPATFDVDSLNISLLKAHLENIMPEKTVWQRKFGWIVPVEETNGETSAINNNAWLHNLMFWESLIEINQAGPVVNWLMKRQALINIIDEQTRYNNRSLQRGKYLPRRWTMRDMHSMIVDLMKVIDEYRDKEKKIEEESDEMKRNARAKEEVAMYCDQLNNMQKQIAMLADMLQKSFEAFKSNESEKK